MTIRSFKEQLHVFTSCKLGNPTVAKVHILLDSSKSPWIGSNWPDLGHVAKSEPISVTKRICILIGQIWITSLVSTITVVTTVFLIVIIIVIHRHWNCVDSVEE